MVNEENLRLGIQIFNNRNWTEDLHNCFYLETEERFNEYLNTNNHTIFWDYIVNNLSKWKALRGKKHFTKQILFDKLREQNNLLRTNINGTIHLNNSFENCEWNNLQDLFEFAKTLKDVRSPVFASKFCHFLFPNLFIVKDNALVGTRNNYENYWSNCKNGWLNCPTKELLIQILSEEIVNPIPNYPYATKIAELCYIGSRN